MAPEDEQVATPENNVPPGREHLLIRRPGWDLWVWWVIASTAGSFSGTALWFVLPSAGCLLYVLPVVLALVEAVFQWMVLRRYLAHFGLWPWAGLTVLGSLVSGLLGSLLGFLFITSGRSYDLVELTLFNAARLAFLSAIIGLAQWFVLRRYSARALWWVLAYPLVSVVHYARAIFLPDILPKPPILDERGEILTENTAMISLLGNVESALITSAIMGFVLVWMLRQAPGHTQSAGPTVVRAEG